MTQKTAQIPRNVDNVRAAMRRGTVKSPTAKNSIVLTVRSMAMVLLTAMLVLPLLELPTLYIAATPESKYKYFVTEDPATWVTYDVQTRAKSAHPSKAIGKSIGRPNTQGGAATSSLGSFMVSPHLTREKRNGGSTKQNKNRSTNTNTMPMGPNKYQQPLINQYLSRSQAPRSTAPSEGETEMEEPQTTDGGDKNDTNGDLNATPPPINL